MQCCTKNLLKFMPATAAAFLLLSLSLSLHAYGPSTNSLKPSISNCQIIVKRGGLYNQHSQSVQIRVIMACFFFLHGRLPLAKQFAQLIGVCMYIRRHVFGYRSNSNCLFRLQRLHKYTYRAQWLINFEIPVLVRTLKSSIIELD